MRVLILTPLKLELEAVLRHLPGCTAKEVNGAAYWFGTFSGKHTEYEVMVCETGMKVVKMALATKTAVDYFNPQIALVIGIAGGIKSDIKKGHVVIGESIYGYGGGKEDETGFNARPDMERCSDKLVAQSKIIRIGRKWEERIHLAAPDGSQPTVHVGQIAVDDKVVATDKGPTFSLIKKHYNDALCLEMEGIGFSHAIQKYKHIEALVIRGISDLCAQKGETDKDNWQDVAADRAGGFGFELLWELDGGNIFKPEEKPITPTTIKTPDTAELKQKTRKLVIQGELQNAIKLLITHLEKKEDAPSYSEIMVLADRYEKLSSKERMGAISNSEAGTERNQIVFGVLQIINVI